MRKIIGLVLFNLSIPCYAENIFDARIMDTKENQLKDIAVNSDKYNYQQLRAGNTTPDAWILTDKISQKRIAVLKCTSGNNYAPADIATYKLGRKLNFPIYPVAVKFNIDKQLASKLKTHPQTCALKEYLTNWSIMHWKAQANLNKVIQQGRYSTYRLSNSFLNPKGDNQYLVQTIMCENNLQTLQGKMIKLTSGVKTSQNGDPIQNRSATIFTSTPVSLIDTAKEFSNLMLIDAVIGNGDRFPGGNLEFRSSINQSRIIAKQTVEIINPRLSSMDVGLSFKGWDNSWAKIELGYYVRRFDPKMIANLKTLQDQLNRLTEKDLQGEWSFLNFKTQFNPRMTAVTYLKKNIQWTLDFVQRVQKNDYKETIPGKKHQCSQPYF